MHLKITWLHVKTPSSFLFGQLKPIDNSEYNLHMEARSLILTYYVSLSARAENLNH